MAYIVKGAGGAKAPRSQLARVGTDMAAYERQRDCYKLALLGNRDMKRLWNDYAAEDPGMARLIVAEVEQDRQEAAKVAVKVDKRLRRAEESVSKSAGPVRKATARRTGGSHDPELAAVLAITNTWQREQAYNLLVRRRGTR